MDGKFQASGARNVRIHSGSKQAEKVLRHVGCGYTCRIVAPYSLGGFAVHNRRDFIASLGAIGVALMSAPVFADATVNYQGYVWADEFTLAPVVSGFAIAGTFAPGFDPNSYHCVYGDSSCNLNGGHYSAAVADGNFIPIGSGDLTDSSGFFSGSGTTSAAPATPIYFFVFATSDPDSSFYWGMATGSSPAFQVPAAMGTTSIDTAAANILIHGTAVQGGIALVVVPFPEPSTFVLLGVALPLVGCGCCRRRAKLPGN
jgi:hypothetical protein